MKRQKRYLTAEMVLQDITKAHKKIAKLKSQAATLDADAEVAKLMGNQSSFEVASDEAETIWKKVERMETTRLRRLQNTLAAFQTKPMFGEEGVVLQRV